MDQRSVTAKAYSAAIDGPFGDEIGYSFQSMTRALRIRCCLLAVLASCAGGAPSQAFAQQRTSAPSAPSPSGAQDRLPQDSAPTNEPKTKEQLEAQQHFQRAKELYASGAYREAIAELEQARTLDPKAKDLVFNLGIVHEKLGRFDEAITFFRQYIEMETVSAPERAKAENVIKRIEGAKRELPVAPVAGGAASGAAATTEPPPTAPQDTKPGRIDVATVTAGSIAIVGLGVGTAFGIMALANQPGADEFTTGRDGSYEALRTKANDANTQAIVADIGFGVGIAAALVTAYLYFGRPREAKTKPETQARLLHLLPSAAPVPSGGVMMLGGTFR